MAANDEWSGDVGDLASPAALRATAVVCDATAVPLYKWAAIADFVRANRALRSLRINSGRTLCVSLLSLADALDGNTVLERLVLQLGYVSPQWCTYVAACIRNCRALVHVEFPQCVFDHGGIATVMRAVRDMSRLHTLVVDTQLSLPPGMVPDSTLDAIGAPLQLADLHALVVRTQRELQPDVAPNSVLDAIDGHRELVTLAMPVSAASLERFVDTVDSDGFPALQCLRLNTDLPNTRSATETCRLLVRHVSALPRLRVFEVDSACTNHLLVACMQFFLARRAARDVLRRCWVVAQRPKLACLTVLSGLPIELVDRIIACTTSPGQPSPLDHWRTDEHDFATDEPREHDDKRRR